VLSQRALPRPLHPEPYGPRIRHSRPAGMPARVLPHDAKVSVVTTVYNGQPYFDGRSRASSRRASTTVEYIIVDDARLIGRPELLREVAAGMHA